MLDWHLKDSYIIDHWSLSLSVLQPAAVGRPFTPSFGGLREETSPELYLTQTRRLSGSLPPMGASMSPHFASQSEAVSHGHPSAMMPGGMPGVPAGVPGVPGVFALFDKWVNFISLDFVNISFWTLNFKSCHDANIFRHGRHWRFVITTAYGAFSYLAPR